MSATHRCVTFEVPIRATASLNARLHWRARAAIVKREKEATILAFVQAKRQAGFRQWAHDFKKPGLAPDGCEITVTLTRIAPRKLDDDNWVAAAKNVRDATAHCLGLDDGDPRLTWRYAQEKGPYAVRVHIECLTRDAA